MSVIEWGHSRHNLIDEENLDEYRGDEEWMNHVGEYDFDVNETCLHADHNIFNLTERDSDSHNPILVHLKPAWMPYRERNSFYSPEYKQEKAQARKERQKENKRKGYASGSAPYGGSASSSGANPKRASR